MMDLNRVGMVVDYLKAFPSGLQPRKANPLRNTVPGLSLSDLSDPPLSLITIVHDRCSYLMRCNVNLLAGKASHC